MYDSGTLKICNLTNIAENGLMPREVLSVNNKFWFEMRTIGINRQYLARGVNERIDLVVRIPRNDKIEVGQYAVLGNGEQYRISHITHGYNSQYFSRMVKKDFYEGYRTVNVVDLDYTELTLVKNENYYEVQDDCETNKD